jgi:4-carboxymuconolactone decarboxylase
VTRIPPITSRDGLSEAQKAVFDSITGGARGAVRGPFTVFLHNPAIAGPVEQLGAFLRYQCTVPQRQRELAILVIGAHWRADYEWFAHAPIARAQGHPEAVIVAIAAGKAPDFETPLDGEVYDFVHEILTAHRVSDQTFARVEASLGKIGALDLVSLVGYYSLLAMVLNTFQVPVPDPAQVPWLRD